MNGRPLSEKVNDGVKNSFRLSFRESVAGLTGKLPDPQSGDGKFENVVKVAQHASVLGLMCPFPVP